MVLIIVTHFLKSSVIITTSFTFKSTGFYRSIWLNLITLMMIFLFYGASAMNAASSTGILRGRPFGGVGVLIHNSLSNLFH